MSFITSDNYAPAPPLYDFKMMKEPFQFKIKKSFTEMFFSDKNFQNAQCGSEMPSEDKCYPAYFNVNTKCATQNIWNNSTRRKTVVKDYIIKER
jgi:hypothetical protein